MSNIWLPDKTLESPGIAVPNKIISHTRKAIDSGIANANKLLLLRVWGTGVLLI